MKEGQGFKLNAQSGYFQNTGVDIMAFDDFYPEGHQGGISIIMHGNRVASNGDIRFERMPGQWSPTPKKVDRNLDEKENTIKTDLNFPNSSGHFDGIEKFGYSITVKGEGEKVLITVDLENPLPEKFAGKLYFNLELFPASLFGKPWIMDDKHGIFPLQSNGPAEPYAAGRRFTVRPDDPYNLLTIESKTGELKLYDSRMYLNNGWFLVSSEIPANVTQNALQWVITPNAVKDWIYRPVIQISQVGYHPNQPKTAIIELDRRETNRGKPVLCKITESGIKEILSDNAKEWGRFLRYNYLKFDFSNIKEEGLYKIKYAGIETHVFRIACDVYDRGVWQPVLEYFLPVQMCHMRVIENARVWHDLCHDDDAQMAPLNHVHFDGYEQGSSTLTKYKSGDFIEGLNTGGWHDAGDDDFRVESQAGEFYILTLAYEAFNINYDMTAIDQEKKLVEIHKSDGKNDILQQIEHGVLSVVGAYRALGRLYRGIIVNSMRQYALMGDFAAQTDGIKGNADDRWVFTEDNPGRELRTAAHLAASSRALKGFNDELSRQALEAAKELFKITDISKVKAVEKEGFLAHIVEWTKSAKIHAAAELFLTTGEEEYKNYLLSEIEFIKEGIYWTGWFVGRAEKAINDANFTKAVREALSALKEKMAQMSGETPYGIPYRPHVWGAGWDIQRLGFEYYYLHKAYPDIFDPDMVFNALNFILGCHPGSNNMSFASGVGAKSATIAYGMNRADWSHIPGGVISGTALIRPDFPELLEYPYLWQQTEYVMGGGSSHYMFLVLAARQILKGD
jgi:hypothetical protein